MTHHHDGAPDADLYALDPDWQHVPPDLAANDGKIVRLVAPDGRVEEGVLAIVPGWFGDAARAREDGGDAA